MTVFYCEIQVVMNLQAYLHKEKPMHQFPLEKRTSEFMVRQTPLQIAEYGLHVATLPNHRKSEVSLPCQHPYFHYEPR